MMQFSTTIAIQASAEAVWAILTDAARYAEWDPGMLRLEGQIALGEKLTIYTKSAPNRAFTPVVAEFDPPRRMVWQSGLPLGLFTGERTFTLEPLDSGQVRFHMQEVFSGPLLGMFGGSIPDLNPTFAAFGEALKARAEST
jgi:hypothetical protein